MMVRPLCSALLRHGTKRMPYGAFAIACRSVLLSTLEPRRFFASRSQGQRKKSDPRSSSSGTAGLIALNEPSSSKNRRSRSQPRICAGCGTQVVSGSTTGGKIFSGIDAVNEDLSKKGSKRARYADLGDYQNTFLCSRCISLGKDGNIWRAYDAIQDVDVNVFAKQLQHIVSRRRFGLCIVVADATDAEHSAPKNLRRSIGKIPAILVLSKCDLMPRMQPRDVRILETKIRQITGLQFIGYFAVSAHMGTGILSLSEFLLENVGGRDVFCVGAANVGKSTLVQKLTKTITPNIYLRGKSGHAQKRKKAMDNIKVTASHLPGTTLQAVRIPCFASDRHALWDTPGIVQTKAVQYSLFPPHLMEPLARPMPLQLTDRFFVRPGQSVLIEASWMDPKDTEITESIDDDNHSDLKDSEKAVLPPINEACVLARMDVISVEGHKDIAVRPYLHPSLRIRVVPTGLAPSTATIPAHHIKRVESLMETSFPDDLVTSRPLGIFESPQSSEGHLFPTQKERSESTGKVYMDLTFASLGWLSLSHPSDFRIKPWCVEGSVFSKRPSIYPTTLSESDVENQRRVWREEIAILKSDEAARALSVASKEGRKKSGAPKERYDDDSTSHELFDDEFWYS